MQTQATHRYQLSSNGSERSSNPASTREKQRAQKERVGASPEKQRLCYIRLCQAATMGECDVWPLPALKQAGSNNPTRIAAIQNKEKNRQRVDEWRAPDKCEWTSAQLEEHRIEGW